MSANTHMIADGIRDGLIVLAVRPPDKRGRWKRTKSHLAKIKKASTEGYRRYVVFQEKKNP